ncbi:hypothetical protein FOA52_004095 [Chlamydomonas sp. UWO 241]|nr:hypothetical protein FOA52_004095 [Chlamydomonas sp. UWO 241]
MLYIEGQLAKAEGEYNTATELEPSDWRSYDFVVAHTRWTPKLYAAFSEFLGGASSQ